MTTMTTTTTMTTMTTTPATNKIFESKHNVKETHKVPENENVIDQKRANVQGNIEQGFEGNKEDQGHQEDQEDQEHQDDQEDQGQHHLDRDQETSGNGNGNENGNINPITYSGGAINKIPGIMEFINTSLHATPLGETKRYECDKFCLVHYEDTGDYTAKKLKLLLFDTEVGLRQYGLIELNNYIHSKHGAKSEIAVNATNFIHRANGVSLKEFVNSMIQFTAEFSALAAAAFSDTHEIVHQGQGQGQWLYLSYGRSIGMVNELMIDGPFQQRFNLDANPSLIGRNLTSESFYSREDKTSSEAATMTSSTLTASSMLAATLTSTAVASASSSVPASVTSATMPFLNRGQMQSGLGPNYYPYQQAYSAMHAQHLGYTSYNAHPYGCQCHVCLGGMINSGGAAVPINLNYQAKSYGHGGHGPLPILQNQMGLGLGLGLGSSGPSGLIESVGDVHHHHQVKTRSNRQGQNQAHLIQQQAQQNRHPHPGYPRPFVQYNGQHGQVGQHRSVHSGHSSHSNHSNHGHAQTHSHVYSPGPGSIERDDKNDNDMSDENGKNEKNVEHHSEESTEGVTHVTENKSNEHTNVNMSDPLKSSISVLSISSTSSTSTVPVTPVSDTPTPPTSMSMPGGVPNLSPADSSRSLLSNPLLPPLHNQLPPLISLKIPNLSPTSSLSLTQSLASLGAATTPVYSQQVDNLIADTNDADVKVIEKKKKRDEKEKKKTKKNENIIRVHSTLSPVLSTSAFGLFERPDDKKKTHSPLTIPSFTSSVSKNKNLVTTNAGKTDTREIDAELKSTLKKKKTKTNNGEKTREKEQELDNKAKTNMTETKDLAKLEVEKKNKGGFIPIIPSIPSLTSSSSNPSAPIVATTDSGITKNKVPVPISIGLVPLNSYSDLASKTVSLSASVSASLSASASASTSTSASASASASASTSPMQLPLKPMVPVKTVKSEGSPPIIITLKPCLGGCNTQITSERDFCSNECPGPLMGDYATNVCWYAEGKCVSDFCELEHDRKYVRCVHCNAMGHVRTECASPQIQCRNCSQYGHFQTQVKFAHQKRQLCMYVNDKQMFVKTIGKLSLTKKPYWTMIAKG